MGLDYISHTPLSQGLISTPRSKGILLKSRPGDPLIVMGLQKRGIFSSPSGFISL